MNEFSQRVALVTGAGGGLCRELVLALANQGAAVGLIDLRSQPLAALAEELPGKPLAWAVADVTDRPALQEAVAHIEERLGPIDLLIAGAGIGKETTALAFDAADIESIVRVNLLGVANSIDAVLKGMLARRRGQLAAISSLASYRGMPRMAGYCASKAGLNALMDSLRVELRPCGIDVTTVCPGWIRTPMTNGLDLPMPYLLEPKDAAGRIIDAIRRRRPFLAFPAVPVWRLRFLSWLPCATSDRLIFRVLRSLSTKR